MSPGPSPGPVESRLHDDVPIVDAESAAAAIDPGATVLTSGFGSVGYPKAIPLALASSPRDLSLTLVASGKVGDKIDVELVGSGQVERRFSYQSSRVAREDRHPARSPSATETPPPRSATRSSTEGSSIPMSPSSRQSPSARTGSFPHVARAGPRVRRGRRHAVRGAEPPPAARTPDSTTCTGPMRPRTAGRSRCRTPASASAPRTSSSTPRSSRASSRRISPIRRTRSPTRPTTTSPSPPTSGRSSAARWTDPRCSTTRSTSSSASDRSVTP